MEETRTKHGGPRLPLPSQSIDPGMEMEHCGEQGNGHLSSFVKLDGHFIPLFCGEMCILTSFQRI